MTFFDTMQALDPAVGEHNHSADRVALAAGRFSRSFRDLVDDRSSPLHMVEGANHGVARQVEPTEVGLVVQVRAWSGVAQLEQGSMRQRFGPQQMVVAPQCRTMSIGVFARWNVGAEVDRDVDVQIGAHVFGSSHWLEGERG